jgi:protein-S-isoprenylcysteine O-methyltransferase Ste14
VLGAALIAAALPVLVVAFVRSLQGGHRHTRPIAPTEHLVVGGLYRYVRNPIYLAVTALIVFPDPAFCSTLGVSW